MKEQHIQFGNILSIDRGIIVHGCNAQGKMNSGIAKAIREKYPQVFTEYERQHHHSGLHMGSIIPVTINRGLIIVNAITQEFYGKDGKKYVSYAAVHSAFQQVAELANEHWLDVHYPLIGAGLGGGDWGILSNVIDNALKKGIKEMDRHLWIYEE